MIAFLLELYLVTLPFNIHIICITVTPIFFDWDCFSSPMEERPHWVLREWKRSRLNVFVPPKFMGWNLFCSVMVFGGGGLWDMIRSWHKPSWMGLVFFWESLESSLAPSAMRGHVRAWPPMTQEAGFHQVLKLAVPYSWTSQSPDMFC